MKRCQFVDIVDELIPGHVEYLPVLTDAVNPMRMVDGTKPIRRDIVNVNSRQIDSSQMSRRKERVGRCYIFCTCKQQRYAQSHCKSHITAAVVHVEPISRTEFNPSVFTAIDAAQLYRSPLHARHAQRSDGKKKNGASPTHGLPKRHISKRHPMAVSSVEFTQSQAKVPIYLAQKSCPKASCTFARLRLPARCMGK